MPFLFDVERPAARADSSGSKGSAKPKVCRRHFASRSALRFGNLGRVSSSMSIEQRLAEVLAECERLRAENRRLREPLGISDAQTLPPPASLQYPSATIATINAKSSPEEKVKLFRSLFRGREDVYAVRWEGQNGKVGYSPAYRWVWGSTLHKIPNEEKEYFPLTDQVIHDHLTGKQTVGVYPLLTDETCWFMAADFDKASWQEDARAFLQTCSEWSIPAALERSRSGRGSHIWIFFDAPIPASVARKLGTALLTRTMERRHELGLDSYDRLFPSQDTMPKGGFGNLIALPMQHVPRGHGNSVFLNANFVPYSDQWAFLSGLRRTKFLRRRDHRPRGRAPRQNHRRAKKRHRRRVHRRPLDVASFEKEKGRTDSCPAAAKGTRHSQ
jgi:hypothetical protein